MSKELLFKAHISENQNNFEKKIALIELFRLHKQIVETAFELINTSETPALLLLSDEYTRVNQELISRNKTYEQLHNEKVFVDIYSAFEKLLSDHLQKLYSFFPKLCFREEQLYIKFSVIFLSQSLENSQKHIIEDKVKSLIQGNTIDKIIEVIFERSQLKDKAFLNNDEKKLVLWFSKIRNLIIHNEALMNKIVLEELQKLKITHNYTEEQPVSENLDGDISQMLALFGKLSKKITDTLVEKALQLVNNDESK